jgi:polar amino acid transport system ATP-binding protein
MMGSAAVTGESSGVPVVTGPPILRVVGLQKGFGARPVLRDVSLDVAEGEVVCIVGPSGSGKTTFIGCINYLVVPDAGEVWVEDERIGHEDLGDGRLRLMSAKKVAVQRRKIGYVFQDFNLFPHMTALQNVIEAPIRVLGKAPEEARLHGLELLDRVGLGDRGGAYPGQLSGGQQQRVAIARSLAMRPRLMLFDEPTSALDPEMIQGVLRVMEELAHEMTMVVVTHEMGFARRAAHRVVMMDEGRIVEQATPQQFFDDPQSQRAKDFLSMILKQQ